MITLSECVSRGNAVHLMAGSFHALCGAENVRSTTWHEIKRGRISCLECLAKYQGAPRKVSRSVPVMSAPQGDLGL